MYLLLIILLGRIGARTLIALCNRGMSSYRKADELNHSPLPYLPWLCCSGHLNLQADMSATKTEIKSTVA